MCNYSQLHFAFNHKKRNVLIKAPYTTSTGKYVSILLNIYMEIKSVIN